MLTKSHNAGLKILTLRLIDEVGNEVLVPTMDAVKNAYGQECRVLPEEPPRSHTLVEAWRNHEDWLEGRLWINPHLAFYSNQAWYEMRYKAAETVNLFFEHGILRNQIKE